MPKHHQQRYSPHSRNDKEPVVVPVHLKDLPNLGWVFYRDYYRDVDFRRIIEDKKIYKQRLEGVNKTFLEKAHSNYAGTPQQKENTLKGLGINQLLHIEGANGFALTTTYPGLLIGTGYTHETGMEGELKLGFFFDHTTGLPILPGSSVKGKLRSMFPSQSDEEKEEKADYINGLLEEILGKTTGYQLKDIIELGRQIFGADTKEEPLNIPMSQRDVFYDAYILKSLHRSANGSPKGAFLAIDFITPHKNTANITALDPFSNPVPLQFLKILPEVVFQFQMKLAATSLGTHTIEATHKEQLFKQIFLDVGIGAKTNVGYGQFSE